ncbi:MAG: 50S ribosomal protein L4 [Saezia sp.]
MELKLLNQQGQEAGKIDVPETLFGREYNEPLIHQIVVAYQANARLATRKQKDRSEVNFSTRKPWKQKGTGRARAGSAGSPLWRKGGVIFPNSPNDNFSQKINKKMYRAAMASIYSKLVRDGRLSIIDSIELEAPKTKLLAQRFKDMGLNSVMLIADDISENLELASRNLPHVFVVEPRYVDPVSLLFYKKVLVTKGAVEKLKEVLA